MSRVTPAIRRMMWEEIQESLRKESGKEKPEPTGPQPIISHFANYDLLQAHHLHKYWINAGIPLLKVPISSAFTIEQARERGEAFGGLLALNVNEYVKILNKYADDCGSPNPPLTAEVLRAKMEKDFAALQGGEAAALAKDKLGWTEDVTKAFFQGASDAFLQN